VKPVVASKKRSNRRNQNDEKKSQTKGDPVLSVEPVGTGTAAVVEEVDNQFTTLQVSKLNLIFQEELRNFTNSLVTTIKLRRRGFKSIYYFCSRKDGSLTDIKVIRDIGYGTGKEAIRVLKNVRNGHLESKMVKKVRVLYSLPITIQSAE
jgi:protein TonB